MTTEQQKFYNIKHTTNYISVGEDVDYKVIVDNYNKEIILQFKESDSKTDWKNNFAFLPCRINSFAKADNYLVTTKGYARAWNSTGGVPLLDFITATYKYPTYRTIIRGWSFGSAMAKIAAYLYTNLGHDLDELTTFGDVKCFFKKIKNTTRIREYVTPNDFVTWCVPFYCRDTKCKVGEKFTLKKLFKTEYYHTHYEEYDYSKFE